MDNLKKSSNFAANYNSYTTMILDTIFGASQSLQVVKTFFEERNKLKENVKVISISDVSKHPDLFMAERGFMDTGFREDVYFQRPYGDGETLDDHVKQIIEKNGIVIICGKYGKGKSRLVYEYLRSEKHPFTRVAVVPKTQLSCTLEELRKRLVSNAGPDTLIYIDNFHNISYDGKTSSDWNDMVDLCREVKTKGGKIVFSCVDNPNAINVSGVDYDSQPQQKNKLLDDLKPYVFEIPNIDREKEHETYEWCRSQFREKSFSPIIGNYVDGMDNFERLFKKYPLKNEEILALSTYIFIGHYFRSQCHDESFFYKAYAHICSVMPYQFKYYGNQYALKEEEINRLKQKEVFKKALDALVKKDIMTVDKDSYYLLDELYVRSLATLLNGDKKDERIDVIQRDPFDLFCALLTKEHDKLDFPQEKWMAQTIVDLDPENPDYYTRAITRAAGSNERKIAQLIKGRFDRHFFDCEKDEQGLFKGIKRIKEEYSSDETRILLNQTIGVILSRSYYSWREDLESYIKAGITINNDQHINSELLRIAGDSRTSEKQKESVMRYLADKLNMDSTALIKEGETNERIALNYEKVNASIDASRIESTLLLFSGELTKALNTHSNIKEELQYVKNEELEAKLDDNQKKLQLIVRSIKSWCRLITLKVGSYEDLEILVQTLKALHASFDELNTLYMNVEEQHFVFFSPISMGAIAHNIRRQMPLNYVAEYNSCFELIRKNMSEQSYIFTRSSLQGFMYNVSEGKEMGVMAETENFSQAMAVIDIAINVKIVDDKHLTKDIFFATLMHQLYDKIETEDDFSKAKEKLEELLDKDEDIVPGAQLKHYNSLLRHVQSWDKAKEMIYNDYFTANGDIYSYNNFLSIARDQYLGMNHSDKTDYTLLDDIAAQIIKIAQIIKTKDMAWDSASYMAVKEMFRSKYSRFAQNEELLSIWENEIQKIKGNNRLVLADGLSKLSLKERLQYLTEIENYYCNGEYSKKYSQQCDSDQISSVLKQTNILFRKIKEKKRNNEKTLSRDNNKIQTDILRKIHDLAWERPKNAKNKEFIDNFFAPKLYYYEEVIYQGYRNTETIEQRWNFIERALRRLVECGNDIVEDEKDIIRKQKKNRNLLEKLVECCSTFEDKISIAEKAKEMAKADVYRDIYRPTLIKILCNGVKEGLQQEDINKIKARIERLNHLISDPELILTFNKDDSALIAKVNTRLHKPSGDKIYFPQLEGYININLPIASTNPIVRHKTWTTYEKQNYLDQLADKSLENFSYREMEWVFKQVKRGKNADISYLLKVMKELQKRNINFEQITSSYGKNNTKYQKDHQLPTTQREDLFKEFLPKLVENEEQKIQLEAFRTYHECLQSPSRA